MCSQPKGTGLNSQLHVLVPDQTMNKYQLVWVTWIKKIKYRSHTLTTKFRIRIVWLLRKGRRTKELHNFKYPFRRILNPTSWICLIIHFIHNIRSKYYLFFLSPIPFSFKFSATKQREGEKILGKQEQPKNITTT